MPRASSSIPMTYYYAMWLALAVFFLSPEKVGWRESWFEWIITLSLSVHTRAHNHHMSSYLNLCSYETLISIVFVCTFCIAYRLFWEYGCNHAVRICSISSIYFHVGFIMSWYIYFYPSFLFTSFYVHVILTIVHELFKIISHIF